MIQAAAATPGVFDREEEVYAARKAEFLGSAAGKFIVIRGDQVIGPYASKKDAVDEGYRRFGNVSFLVKHVTDLETPVNFVSPNLGI